MTDLHPDSETRRYSLPASSRWKWFNRAAIVCLLLLIPLALLMIEMHPRVPTFVSALLVGLPLVSVVLGVLGRKKNLAPKAAKRSLGSTLTTVGVIISLVVLFIAILTPSLCRAREPANRVKCASNLRQIGLGLMMYADAHEGEYPATLDVLISDPKLDMSPEVFVCPSGPDERAMGITPEDTIRNFREQPNHQSYVYLGAGLSNTMTSDQILMYEHAENHKTGGMNVLFGDGHVQFYEKDDSEKLVAELAAGNNLPTRK